MERWEVQEEGVPGELVNFGLGILDFGFWILDFGLGILK